MSSLSDWRTSRKVLGKMLGRVIKWARNRLTMRLEANLRWLDRTQEVAGSSPASSIAYLPDSPTG
jgi:hypothetical protein